MVRAVAQLRDASGLTNEELWQGAQMSRSYFYSRMQGRAAFDANDFDLLASALGTHPHEISRVAAALGDESVEPTLLVDRGELARRVNHLTESPIPSGEQFEGPTFLASLDSRGLLVAPSEWQDLTAPTDDEPIRVRLLEALSEYCGVPLAYLTSFDDDTAVEATEAQLEFRLALKESGADAVAMRAVGDVSPAALRAIARSIRTIGSG